jgi:anti-anti-sigma factor
MTSSIRERFPLSSASAAVHDGNKLLGDAQLPLGTCVSPGPRREDAPALAELAIHDRGDVAVVSLRGELDFSSASSLQAYLIGIRCQGHARLVADLAGLALIDCACLRVLAACRAEIQAAGGGFALAGPQGAVLRILAVTGLLSWFEVHDSVEDAVTGAGAQRSATFLATPSGSSPRGVLVIPGDRSRMISEVSMSLGSAVAADHGSRHGRGAVPALGWLS